MSVEYSILGLKDLHNMLQTFPAIVEKRILRSSILQASNVIKDEAKRLSPSKGIKKNIQVTSQKSRPGTIVYNTAVKKTKDSFFAQFLEYGTATGYTGKGKSTRRPYVIQTRKTKLLTSPSKRRVKGYQIPIKNARKMLKIPPNKTFKGGFFSSVTHPGIRAKPFMKRALDNKKTEAIKVFGHVTKLGINMYLGQIQKKRILRKDIKEVFK